MQMGVRTIQQQRDSLQKRGQCSWNPPRRGGTPEPQRPGKLVALAGRKRQWCHLTGAVAVSRTWLWLSRLAASPGNKFLIPRLTPSLPLLPPFVQTRAAARRLESLVTAAPGTQPWGHRAGWSKAEGDLQGTPRVPAPCHPTRVGRRGRALMVLSSRVPD